MFDDKETNTSCNSLGIAAWCTSGEDMMAAQITNAQQSQRKYGRKHERKYGRIYERKYGRKHERKYRRKLDFVQRCETQD